ncbi:MAG: alpha/beta fold hydrolase [Gemmatimonadota bacterium]|nr:alpha/beta fold hydrolase [Gemmatimonadota bacterium]
MTRAVFVAAAVLVAATVGWLLSSAWAERGAEVPSERTSPAGARLPVLLVPGWLDTAQDLADLRARLVSAGWPAERVRAVSFEEPAGSNRDHARELDDAARALLEATGADSLDIVAHSMGGLATRWYLSRGDPVPVRRVAFLATPHRGTMSAHLAWGPSREEMIPGSSFLDSLNVGPPVPEGVEALTVRTPIDTHVLPGENATLPGVPDLEVCCPTHPGVLGDAEVFRAVLRFLESGEVGG